MSSIESIHVVPFNDGTNGIRVHGSNAVPGHPIAVEHGQHGAWTAWYHADHVPPELAPLLALAAASANFQARPSIIGRTGRFLWRAGLRFPPVVGIGILFAALICQLLAPHHPLASLASIAPAGLVICALLRARRHNRLGIIGWLCLLQVSPFVIAVIGGVLVLTGAFVLSERWATKTGLHMIAGGVLIALPPVLVAALFR